MPSRASRLASAAPIPFVRRHRGAALALSGLLSGLPASAQVFDHVWIPGLHGSTSFPYSWNDWRNWSNAQVPNYGNVLVESSDTAELLFGQGRSDQLYVGFFQTGRLSLQLSDFVSNDTVFVGNNNHAGEIEAASSDWNGTRFIVGSAGDGRLTISGGSVFQSYSSNNVATLVVGDGAGRTGTVELTSSSTWTHNRDIVVGNSGSGTLRISDSGTRLENTFATIAAETGSTGTVEVTANALWTQTGGVRVGHRGSGVLTIHTGATANFLDGAGTVDLGSGGGTGVLNIGTPVGHTPGAAGTLVSGTVTGHGSGTNVVNFNHTTNGHVFAPSLAGALSLQHNGSAASRTVLTGSAAHTGGTWINAGTLQIGDGSASASLSGPASVASGATLAFNPAAAGYTYSAAVSGPGTLSKVGGHTLVLLGANTPGGISLTGGTLQVGAGGTTGSLSATSATPSALSFGSGAVLAFNRSDAVNYHGSSAVTGSGSISNRGAGALTLNASFNVGDFTLESQAGAGPLTVTGAVAASAALRVNGPNAVRIDGALSGAGSLVKSDAGLLTLYSTGNYTGGTTLNAGTLTLNADGALGSGAIRVFGGGIRAGGAPRNLANSLNLGATGSSTMDFTVGRLTTFSGPVTLSGHTRFVASNPDGLADNDTVFSGNITGSRNVTIAQGNGSGTNYGIGTGAIVFSGANTFSQLNLESGRFGATSDAALGAAGIDLIFTGAAAFQPRANFVSGRALRLNANGASYETSYDSGAGVVATDTTFARFTNTRDFTVNGSGAFRLSGATTFYATLSIASGATFETKPGASFNVGDVSSIGALQGDVVNNGTLTFNYMTASRSGAITGSGSVAKNGNTTLTLLGDTSPASFSINAGTVRIGDGGSTGSITGPVQIASGATLEFNRTGSTAHTGGVISGSGHLLKNGSGTVTLHGANTYTGGTTVSAGTLALGASHRLADNGDLTVNGGTFALGAFDETIDQLTFSSGSITGTGTLSASSFQVSGGTLGAPLGGNGALTKTGSGTLTLSAANTYTGGTTIQAGALELAASERLADSGDLSVTGGSLHLGAFNETVRHVTLGTAAIHGTGTLTASSFTSTGASGTANLHARLAGPARLTHSGASTLYLRNTNAHTGGTTVSAGTLSLEATGALGATGDIAMTGGTLVFANDTTDYSARFVKTGGQSFRLQPGAQNLVLASRIEGTNTSLRKLGAAGALVLTADNTHGGGTFVEAGTLQLGDGGATGSVQSAIDLASGATLAFNRSQPWTISAGITGSGAFSQLGAGSTTLAGPLAFSGLVAVSGSGSLILDTPASPSGALRKSGSGTLVLADAVTASAPTVLSGGTLRIGDGATSGSLTGDLTSTGATSLVFDRSDAHSFAGSLGGTLGLVQAGSGTLTLSGPLSYTGATTLSAGTLRIDSNSDRTLTGGFSGTGRFEKTGSGVLTLTSASAHSATGGILIANGTLRLSGPGLVFSSGAPSPTLTGQVEIASGATLALDQNGYTNAGFIGAPNVPLDVAMTLDVSGSGALTRGANNSGIANTVTLNGTLTHTGPTTLSAGTLAFGDSRDFTFASPTSGPGALRKNGSGTVTALALGHAGPTTVSAGTLRIGNGTTTNVPDGPLSILSGARAVFDLGADATYEKTINLVGTLEKTGAHTLVLQPDADSTSRGRVSIGDGILALSVPSGERLFSADIDGAGVFSKQGGGVLRYQGRLNPAGGTRIEAGALRVVSTNNPGSIDGDIRIDAGATLDLATGDGFTLSGPIHGAGSLALSNASYTFSGPLSYSGTTSISGGARMIVSASTDSTLSGAISGSGTLEKRDSSTLTLGGDNSAFTGGTTLDGGTVVVAGNNAFGTGRITINSAQALRGDSTPRTIANPISLFGNLTLGGADDNLTFTTTDLTTGGQSVTKVGAGRVTFTSPTQLGLGGVSIQAGTLALAGANAFAGTDVTLSGGVLDVGATTATIRNFILSGGTVSGTTGSLSTTRSDMTLQSGRVSAALIGTANISKTTSGTVILDGLSSYSGRTDITDGVLEITHLAPTGQPSSIGSGPSLSFGTTTGTERATLRYVGSGGSTDRLPGINRSGAIIESSGTGALEFTGTDSLYAFGPLTLGGTHTGPNVFNPALGGNALSSLTKTGPGTWTLGGANTYTGDTRVEGGTLGLARANALPSATQLHVATGAVVQADNHDQTVSGLHGSGTVHLGAGTLTVVQTYYGVSSGVFSGNIASGSLRVQDAVNGLVLSGANTYAGPTSVANSRLLVNGSLNPASTVTLGRQSFLGGSGSLGPVHATQDDTRLGGTLTTDHLTLGGSAVLAPGDTLGSLNTSITDATPGVGAFHSASATFQDHSVFEWDLTDASGVAGTGWDLLTIDGAASIESAAGLFTLRLRTLDFSGGLGLARNFDPALNHRFNFLATGHGVGFGALASIGGSFAIDTSAVANAFDGTWKIEASPDGKHLDLVYLSAIPEPAAFAVLAGLGALGATTLRRRRR